MHPTRCWQGSGRDELIGLFHPLCLKSTAWMGHCTYPLLLLAAEQRWMRPLLRGIHQRISRDPLGCDSSRGCPPALLPSSVPPRCRASSVRAQEVACPLLPLRREKWPRTGKTPQWGGKVCVAPAHKQAGWEDKGFRKCCFTNEGVKCPAAAGPLGRNEATPHPNWGIPVPPGPGLRGVAARCSLRLGAKADVRHAPPAGSFPSKQLGALIPLCERKPAAVLTVHPRRG